jgi:hypothetical protein
MRNGLPMRVSRCGQQADIRLARDGHHYQIFDYQYFAAQLLGSFAHAEPTRPLRPRWAVLRQRVPPTAPRLPGATLAEPPGLLLR